MRTQIIEKNSLIKLLMITLRQMLLCTISSKEGCKAYPLEYNCVGGTACETGAVKLAVKIHCFSTYFFFTEQRFVH